MVAMLLGLMCLVAAHARNSGDALRGALVMSVLVSVVVVLKMIYDAVVGKIRNKPSCTNVHVNKSGWNCSKEAVKQGEKEVAIEHVTKAGKIFRRLLSRRLLWMVLLSVVVSLVVLLCSIEVSCVSKGGRHACSLLYERLHGALECNVCNTDIDYLNSLCGEVSLVKHSISDISAKGGLVDDCWIVTTEYYCPHGGVRCVEYEVFVRNGKITRFHRMGGR